MDFKMKPNIRSWRSDIEVERRPINRTPRTVAVPPAPIPKPLQDQIEHIAARVANLDWRDAEGFALQKSMLVGALKKIARNF
jgi:hypothetical protein